MTFPTLPFTQSSRLQPGMQSPEDHLLIWFLIKPVSSHPRSCHIIKVRLRGKRKAPSPRKKGGLSWLASERSPQLTIHVMNSWINPSLRESTLTMIRSKELQFWIFQAFSTKGMIWLGVDCTRKRTFLKTIKITRSMWVEDERASFSRMSFLGCNRVMTS